MGDTRPGLAQAFLTSEARYLVSITVSPVAIICKRLEDEASVLTRSDRLAEMFYCTRYTLVTSAGNALSRGRRVRGSAERGVGGGWGEVAIENGWCVCASRS